MSEFRIIINEDNDHYFKNPNFEMTESGLRKYVDYYADRQIDTISFCIYGSKANYPSEVCDAIWDPLPDGTCPDGSLPEHSWPANLQKMFSEGLDPYVIWLDQCRKRNVISWLSIRMNDCHYTFPSLRFRADRRWFNNPDWVREPDRFELSTDKDWQYYSDLQAPLCWNYARPEVRNLIYSVIEESARRYTPDAMELDFCRDCFCLTPGHAEEEAAILTDLLRKCRKAFDAIGKKRGRRLALVVRVPWTPSIARAWGFDVATWAELKLIDTVIASPYWRSTPNDFSLADWQLAVGPDIPVYPASDQWQSPGPKAQLYQTTAAFVRGWCDNMAGDGAQGVYLFNLPYFLHPGYIAPGEDCNFRKMLDDKMTLPNIQAGPRRYQLCYIDLPESEDGICMGPMPAVIADTPYTVVLPINTLPAPEAHVSLTAILASDELPGSVTLSLNGIPVARDGRVDASALRSGENKITLVSADGQAHTVHNIFLDIAI